MYLYTYSWRLAVTNVLIFRTLRSRRFIIWSLVRHQFKERLLPFSGYKISKSMFICKKMFIRIIQKLNNVILWCYNHLHQKLSRKWPILDEVKACGNHNIPAQNFVRESGSSSILWFHVRKLRELIVSDWSQEWSQPIWSVMANARCARRLSTSFRQLRSWAYRLVCLWCNRQLCDLKKSFKKMFVDNSDITKRDAGYVWESNLVIFGEFSFERVECFLCHELPFTGVTKNSIWYARGLVLVWRLRPSENHQLHALVS